MNICSSFVLFLCVDRYTVQGIYPEMLWYLEVVHPVDDIEKGETEREQVPDTKSILFLRKNMWIFNWSIDSSSHSKLTFSASASCQAFVVLFHLLSYFLLLLTLHSCLSLTQSWRTSRSTRRLFLSPSWMKVRESKKSKNQKNQLIPLFPIDPECFFLTFIFSLDSSKLQSLLTFKRCYKRLYPTTIKIKTCPLRSY